MGVLISNINEKYTTAWALAASSTCAPYQADNVHPFRVEITGCIPQEIE